LPQVDRAIRIRDFPERPAGWNETAGVWKRQDRVPRIRRGVSCWSKGVRSGSMKKDVHPEYYETTVTCGCGASFKTRSTRKELKVDICSSCHPYYTGKLKYVDTAGRIEKFQTKFASGSYASLQSKTAKKKGKS
jgi:large subunit ribosomal protein L31